MTQWRTWSGIVALGALALGVGPAASAQAPVAALETAPAERPDPDAIPDSQKLALSTKAISSMRAGLSNVMKSLDEARRSRDVVKLNCVNEKLTELKGLLRISEQADVALQEAVATRNEVGVRHEFTKLDIAGSRASTLQRESAQCIGQLAFRTDENLSVEVEEPDDLFGTDPTRPAEVTPITSRAPPASPTR